jgi:hypothetical protein
MAADAVFREGETAVRDFTLKDGTTAVNLTSLGATAVVFRLKSQVDGTLFGYTVAIQDAASGVVRYTQGASDMPAAKSPFKGYFEVTGSGGIKYLFPNSRDMNIESLPKYV